MACWSAEVWELEEGGHAGCLTEVWELEEGGHAGVPRCGDRLAAHNHRCYVRHCWGAHRGRATGQEMVSSRGSWVFGRSWALVFRLGVS